jgi:hypothetical protein
MKTLRYALLLQSLLVVSPAIGASSPVSETVLCQLRDALAIPGTGLSSMTTQQSARMACRVNELLTGNPYDVSRLGEFVSALRAARQSEVTCTKRVCAGGRTLRGVCCQMGVLVSRQQEHERSGRKPQLAAVVSRLVQARRNGASEKQVQEMTRQAVANNELSPGADAECRSIQQRLDRLTVQLVKIGRSLATHASGGVSGEPNIQALAVSAR